MSRTAIAYEVALDDAFQLIVKVLLDCVGPGLLVDPGLGLLGVAGTDAITVKSSTDQPVDRLLLSQLICHQVYPFAEVEPPTTTPVEPLGAVPRSDPLVEALARIFKLTFARTAFPTEIAFADSIEPARNRIMIAGRIDRTNRKLVNLAWMYRWVRNMPH